jgi:hypothetical protein
LDPEQQLNLGVMGPGFRQDDKVTVKRRHDLRRHPKDRAGVAGGRGRHLLWNIRAEGPQEDAGAAEGRRRQPRHARRVPHEREMLVETRPKIFYFTEHYRDYPMVLIRLSKAKRTAVEPFLRRRWRELASKKAVREFDGER